MADSTRKEIKDALALDFGEITVANGYKTDVGGVSKKFLPFDKLNKRSMPYLCLIGGLSRYESNESTITVNYELSVTAYFHIQDEATDEDLLEQALDNLLDDINVKLFTQETNVEDYVMSISVRETFADPILIDGIGVCYIVLNIEFAQL